MAYYREITLAENTLKSLSFVLVFTKTLHECTTMIKETIPDLYSGII